MDNKLKALRAAFGLLNHSNLDSDDFLFTYGNAKDALLYASLFLPETIEVEGTVLLKLTSGYDEAKQRFLARKQERTEEERIAAEQSFNYIELPYIFGDISVVFADEVYYALAEQIEKAWRAWLPYYYPGRNFEIATSYRADDSATVISFYERERKD